MFPGLRSCRGCRSHYGATILILGEGSDPAKLLAVYLRWWPRLGERPAQTYSGIIYGIVTPELMRSI
jgi:hypothetical protein